MSHLRIVLTLLAALTAIAFGLRSRRRGTRNPSCASAPRRSPNRRFSARCCACSRRKRARDGGSANLGDTGKVWNALLLNQIDAYCEYTGTLTQQLLTDRRRYAGEAAADAAGAASA